MPLDLDHTYLMSLLQKRAEKARELDQLDALIQKAVTGTAPKGFTTVAKSKSKSVPVDRDLLRKALSDGKRHPAADLAKSLGNKWPASDVGRVARKLKGIVSHGDSVFSLPPSKKA